jgi:hypothetical protein
MDIGRIEEIEAQFKGFLDKRTGLFFVKRLGPAVRRRSIGHRTKTEAGDGHPRIAEPDVFHKTVYLLTVC